MERLNDEIGWNQLRYDIRTYTAQNERNRRGGEAGKVPDGYKYIGDRCFLNNGKVHEVVLPEECRIIGKQAFEGCQFQKVVAFPEDESLGENVIAETFQQGFQIGDKVIRHAMVKVAN